MNISSIIIHTHPQKSTAMQRRLADIPGVDVHTATDDGRIIITVEDTPANAPSETLMNVQNMQGVLSAALVYNYCDD